MGEYVLIRVPPFCFQLLAVRACYAPVGSILLWSPSGRDSFTLPITRHFVKHLLMTNKCLLFLLWVLLCCTNLTYGQQTMKVPFKPAAVGYNRAGTTAYLLHRRSFMDADLVVYDVQTWKKLRKKNLSFVSPRLSLNANDSLIAFSTGDKIWVLDAQTLKIAQILWERVPQKLIEFDPVAPTLCATVAAKKNIQIRDLRNDSILLEIKRHNAPIQLLGYRPDGKYLFSLDKNGTLCVWSPAEKKQLAELEHVQGTPYWNKEGELCIGKIAGDSLLQQVSLQAIPGGEKYFNYPMPPIFEVLPAPVIGYAPETGFILGLGFNVILHPFPGSRYYRPSMLTTSFSHGFNGNQWLLNVSFSRYLKDRWYIAADLQYNIHAKSFYFGLGQTAGREDKQAYTATNFLFNGGVYRLLSQQLGLGVLYDVRHNKRTRFGQEMTEQQLPPGAEGGLALGLGAGLRFDNRDNVLAPSRGAFLQLNYLRYGRDYHYHEIKADLRKYFPLGNPVNGRQLAIQGAADLTWDGQPPFYMLPYFTADKALRGIYRNLYIDNQVAFAQVEFRSRFSAGDPRFGYAIFAGAADGANNFFRGYQPDIKAVYGLGIRQQVYPKNHLLLRMDAAWTSKGDFGIFAGLGTSF